MVPLPKGATSELTEGFSIVIIFYVLVHPHIRNIYEVVMARIHAGPMIATGLILIY